MFARRQPGNPSLDLDLLALLDEMHSTGDSASADGLKNGHRPINGRGLSGVFRMRMRKGSGRNSGLVVRTANNKKRETSAHKIKFLPEKWTLFVHGLTGPRGSGRSNSHTPARLACRLHVSEVLAVVYTANLGSMTDGCSRIHCGLGRPPERRKRNDKPWKRRL